MLSHKGVDARASGKGRIWAAIFHGKTIGWPRRPLWLGMTMRSGILAAYSTSGRRSPR